MGSQRVGHDWVTKHNTVLYWFSFYFSKVCKFSRVTIMILKFLEFLLCARPHAKHFTSFILFKSSQEAHKGGAITLQRRKLRLKTVNELAAQVLVTGGTETWAQTVLCELLSSSHLSMMPHSTLSQSCWISNLIQFIISPRLHSQYGELFTWLPRASPVRVWYSF